VITGRTQAGGGQAAVGTQTSPSVAQHPYPCRQAESVVQEGVQSCWLAIGVQAADAPQAGEVVHAALQKPPG
jgi:hypothetical protein